VEPEPVPTTSVQLIGSKVEVVSTVASSILVEKNPQLYAAPDPIALGTNRRLVGLGLILQFQIL
jgi:hypothetical protein